MQQLFAFLLGLALANLQAHTQTLCNRRGLPTSSQLLASLQTKPVNISPRDFVAECNVNDSIKIRLTYLLNWRWTDQEIQAYLETEIQRYKNFYQIEKKASLVAKGNDSLYQKAVDSLIAETNTYTRKYMDQNHLFGVREVTVLVIGWLDMKETMPFLKDSALKDQDHYAQWSVELALARMGDKALQAKIIKESQYPDNETDNFSDDYYNKYRKLRYIGTQESYCQIANFIDTSKYLVSTSAGQKASFAFRVASDLRVFIQNPDLIALLNKMGEEETPDNIAITNVKNWMIKNKGRYIFKPSLCPY